MNTGPNDAGARPRAYICTACGHEQRGFMEACERGAGRRLIAHSFALMMYGEGFRELFKDASTTNN
jgi:hypothetical protein